MSQTQARRPEQTISEKIDGQKVTALIYSGDRNWEAVIVVKRGDEKWTLGIDDDATAHVEETTEEIADLAGEIDVPGWIEDVLLGMGIERVEA